MVATANGLDARLMQAAQALLAAGRGSPDGQPMSLAQFLRLRCEQLLAAYPTTLEDDAALLARLEAQLAEQQRAALTGQRGPQQAQQGAAEQRRAFTPAAARAVPAEAEESPRLQQLATAVRYRLGKKRVLRLTLDAAQAALQQGRSS